MPNYTTILLLYLAVLLLLAVLGGSVGAWLGMYVWHHKTRHKKFKYCIPLILLVQVAFQKRLFTKYKSETLRVSLCFHVKMQGYSSCS